MKSMNSKARQQALQVYQSFETKPTSLVSYQSQGCVLIVGDYLSHQLCNEFSPGLDVLRVAIDENTHEPSDFHGLQLKQTQGISIRGYLGAFEIELTDGSGVVQQLQADIVLDLMHEPLLGCELLPPGYVHETADGLNLKKLEIQLLDMIGEFEKPKYFQHDESICAHSVNGKTVCTRCIDACPAEAISSLAQKIEVNPNLCQGGGSCATVCPSGAIQYVYPTLADSGNRMRQMLQHYFEQGGKHPLVVFYSSDEFPEQLLLQHDAMLPVAVEEIASVGPELCLSTLAYGASQVLLLDNEEVPALSVKTLNQQLDWLQDVLTGLHLKPQAISLLPAYGTFQPITSPVSINPAQYSMPGDKRKAFFQALDHLYHQLDTTSAMVSLSMGAPFGTVTIDDNSCTLCMACISACPGKALQDGSNREMPEVFFIESHCLQCGACTQTCPEQAIDISPRLILEREQRNKPRMLNQDRPFACISCGKPFAPTSVINKMNLALKDHHMFQTSRALNRLKMCEDCRVADIVQDPDAMQGNFDPLKSNSGKPLS